MENHLGNRPHKAPFPLKTQIALREDVIEKVKLKFLPDDRIIKILLIGSSVKASFGKYAPPGFRGSLYSDFDFIFFVEDDYAIPQWLAKDPLGKPFHDKGLDLAYKIKKFIDEKYNAEIFFVRRATMENPMLQKDGELAGIPMTNKSKQKHLIIYCSQSSH